MGIISMKKNNIGYLLREGFKGVFLHGFMSFAAICVTVACLIIMGTFSLILYNLHVMILDLEQENEILVYIDENYSEAKAKSVGSQINLISNVHEAKFVSRQQALDEFIDTQNDAALFDGIEADTLRDRFVVTLEDNSLITQTKEMLKQIDGVDEVSAHDEIANGFQTVQKVLNIAAMVIIVVLFVVSMFIISNTIKLAMYSRSQEIAIMKMVGATNSFIRLRWSLFSSSGVFMTSSRRKSHRSIRCSSSPSCPLPSASSLSRLPTRLPASSSASSAVCFPSASSCGCDRSIGGTL